MFDGILKIFYGPGGKKVASLPGIKKKQWVTTR